MLRQHLHSVPFILPHTHPAASWAGLRVEDAGGSIERGGAGERSAGGSPAFSLTRCMRGGSDGRRGGERGGSDALLEVHGSVRDGPMHLPRSQVTVLIEAGALLIGGYAGFRGAYFVVARVLLERLELVSTLPDFPAL
jgi:hypothetical protein